MPRSSGVLGGPALEGLGGSLPRLGQVARDEPDVGRAEPAERLSLLRSVAQLYEERLRDKASAFTRYASAFEIAPGDAQSQSDLERAAAANGAWSS